MAIKRIHPDTHLTPLIRSRFRREARLAARLNHPSIAQIYHVLHEDDADSIVMEYVEGQTLRQLSSGQPLPLLKALDILRQVVEGLSEAHRRGIVHRDLKSENVLVSESGRAKIADFGIAKPLAIAPSQEPLTAERSLLGTRRSMSPEQALGKPADFRSDFFSLGVLIFETLTGRSPFLAESDWATLDRVVNRPHPSAVSIRPETPPELSDLIDRLLEKDPRRRPRSGSEVVATLDEIYAALAQDSDRTRGSTENPVLKRRSLPNQPPWKRAWVLLGLLVLIAASLIALNRFIGTPQPQRHVAVMKPELESGLPEEAALLPTGIRVALIQSLVSLQGIVAVDPQEVDAVEGTHREVAGKVAADEVVRTRLNCRGFDCHVVIERIDVESGNLLWTRLIEIAADDFHEMATAVMGNLRLGFPNHPLRSGTPDLEFSSRDYRDYCRLRRQYFDRDRDVLLEEVLLEGLSAIRNSSPKFVEPYLLESWILRRRFIQAREEPDWKRGFDLARQALALSPGDPRTLRAQFLIALSAGKLQLAEEVQLDMKALNPGDSLAQGSQALLWQAQGKGEQALELMRKVVARRPSWRNLWNLADMESQLGETESARLHLGQLLERKPDDYLGLSLLAQIELTEGDPEKAAAIYAGLVERSGASQELTNLGVAHLLLGHYEEAVESFLEVRRLAPGNAWALLNLADAYQMQGRSSDAEAAYSELLEVIKRDPAASGWQFLSVRAQAHAQLGQSTRAVEAIQQALRMAPAGKRPRGMSCASY